MTVSSTSTRTPDVAQAALATSLVDLIRARVADGFDRPAVIEMTAEGVGGPGTRRITWGGLINSALDYACALEASGLTRGDRLAHIGPNSVEWIVVDLACLLSGVIHVPLHEDASPAMLEEQLAWLAPLRLADHRTPGARGMAAARDGLGRTGPPMIHAVSQLDRHDLLRLVNSRAAACDPDAPAAIFLSSGTTGLPRGVVHCQRALAWNAAAASGCFLDDPRDVRLAWLPLSHAYPRVGDLYTTLLRGGTIAVVRDRRRVLDACRLFAPTVILGVPAFFDRVAAAIAAGRITDLPAALGGALRVCVSGGAPLRERTSAAFTSRGIPLVQGYGLAEAGPVVALSNPRIARTGTVGPPLTGLEIRLGPRGQLSVRTPSVALEVIDPSGRVTRPQGADGWLETGDLGRLDEAGHLVITGRSVDSLVLSSGVKVPPAEVERCIAEDPAVAQVCVLGQGLAAPVALVVPEPSAVRAAVRRLGLRVFSRRRALAHPRLVRWLARRIAARQVVLPPAWRARRAVFVGRPFDAAHGEATDSLKLRRDAIAAHFSHVLAAAAKPDPPAWMAAVPPRAPPPTLPADHSTSVAHPLATAVWRGTAGGFAAAAAVAPLADDVAAVLERADSVIAMLRADGSLYEAATAVQPQAPIVDAPPPPTGVFTAVAEAMLGDTGLWGISVPEAFGGIGASLGSLARAITHLATRVPTAAGLLSVHSSIGAVSALTAFGSPDQQARHLPGLAQGRPLSIFGGTEPGAGCDLSAVETVIAREGDGLVVSGTKMFITGATYGRLVKILARQDGRPTVALVRLPATDTPSFRLRRYALHPLKHAHNAALEFSRHPVDPADVLTPPVGREGPDAMSIIWHGLNRGRVTLAAQAAGTLRILLTQARDHALRRTTWRQPIASRELVQGRLGRIAARIAACDALTTWAAMVIDSGETGELEAITAKIVAGECVRESAIDALGVHGGRAFLVGHPLGDSFHDHFAVTVYEGESDLLGLALFKGLAKRHPLAAWAHCSAAISRAGTWLAWRAGTLARDTCDGSILDRALREHARRARRDMARVAIAIDRSIRRYGRSLADRQLEIGALSSRVRDLASVLAVSYHADAAADDHTIAAADVWCRLALSRAAGRPLAAVDHAAVAALGRHVVTDFKPG